MSQPEGTDETTENAEAAGSTEAAGEAAFEETAPDESAASESSPADGEGDIASDAEGAPESASEAASGRPRALNTVRAGNEDMWVEARGPFEEKDVSGYVPSPESEQLRVELSLFEGPLDLLLHLIEKHALDIFDIPISRITEEYLKILDDMRNLNLDIAGEFLLMASRLAHIKSRMLLPKEERPEDEEEEDGVDPRLELVKRLIEYAIFRDAAQKLAEREWLGRDVFLRPPSRPEHDTTNPDDPLGTGLEEFEVTELIGVLEEVLRRSKKRVVHEVIAERLNVGARINELVDFARMREHFTLHDAIREFGGFERRNVIVTFLAVLEMARLKLVKVTQPGEGSTIYIAPIMENLLADDAIAEDNSFDEDLRAAEGEAEAEEPA